MIGTEVLISIDDKDKQFLHFSSLYKNIFREEICLTVRFLNFRFHFVALSIRLTVFYLGCLEDLSLRLGF